MSKINELGLYPYPHKNEARNLERNGFGSFIDYFELSDYTSKVEIAGITPGDCERILDDFYSTALNVIDDKFKAGMVSKWDGESPMEWEGFQDSFKQLDKLSLTQFKNRIKKRSIAYELIFDVVKMIEEEYYETELPNQQNN